MPFAPKASVRVNLALTILLSIVLSWVISTGISNYLFYLNMRAMRQEMLRRPDLYRRSLPEPKFGIVEFLQFGPSPPSRAGGALHRPAPDDGEPDMPRNIPNDRGPEPRDMPNSPFHPSPFWFESRWLLVRLAVALGLAALAGAWLGRRFTQPLTQLAHGAEAYHAGNLDYRIPVDGRNEFAAVATAMNDMALQVSGHIGRLEREAERRRQFMADIAHELRSPVTTMCTMARALQDGLADEPERKERAISSLVRTSDRLLRLVQDLMELAKLDISDLPLSRVAVDVRELLSTVLQLHEAEADGAGVVLHPVDAGAPVVLSLDPDRMTQVFGNVIGNAISHAGAQAEVRVEISDGESVRITVTDTGRGIPADVLPHVFDAFYRADAARTPGDRHSGLGLGIARRIVEMHGGNLTIESEEARGVTVAITLPKGM